MVERTEVPCLGRWQHTAAAAISACGDTDKFVAAHSIGDRLLRLTGMYQPQSPRFLMWWTVPAPNNELR